MSNTYRISRGSVVKIKTGVLAGAIARVVRRSRKTGGLTLAMITACGAYGVDSTVNMMPFEVEPAVEARS